MTELENKILTALKEKNTKMAKFDAERKAEADKIMKEAEEIRANGGEDAEFWYNDKKHSAEWELGFQHHGYEFVEEWCNVIAQVMYGRVYHEWHSACPGKHGTGHGAFSTTELTHDEHSNVYKVFKGLVKQGYLRLSKSGYKAKLVK